MSRAAFTVAILAILAAAIVMHVTFIRWVAG